MCESVLPSYMSEHYMQACYQQRLKMVMDPMELKLQMIGATLWTWEPNSAVKPFSHLCSTYPPLNSLYFVYLVFSLPIPLHCFDQ